MDAQLRRSHKSCFKWPTIDFQHIKLSCVESSFSHLLPRLGGSLSLLCDSGNLYIFGKERFPSQWYKPSVLILEQEIQKQCSSRLVQKKSLYLFRGLEHLKSFSRDRWMVRESTRWLNTHAWFSHVVIPYSSTLNHMAIITQNVLYAYMVWACS